MKENNDQKSVFFQAFILPFLFVVHLIEERGCMRDLIGVG